MKENWEAGTSIRKREAVDPLLTASEETSKEENDSDDL
jgi:hypothetical protein